MGWCGLHEGPPYRIVVWTVSVCGSIADIDCPFQGDCVPSRLIDVQTESTLCQSTFQSLQSSNYDGLMKARTASGKQSGDLG